MPRSRGHHLTLPRFHRKHNKNLKLLYALRVCRDLISKFTLFFVPIFFYQLGSGTELLKFIPVSDFQRGMIALGMYYVVSNIIGSGLVIPSGRLTLKIGFQKTIIISYMLLFANLLTLYFLGNRANLGLYLLAAVLNGIQSQLFWCSYLTLLSKNTKQAHMGQDLGLLQLLLQIAGVVAPAISGMIALFLGIESLFIIGIVVTLIAMIVVLLMEDQKLGYQASWTEFFRWLRERHYERFAISVVGGSMYDNVVFIWPLYVFVLLGSVDKVGYLYTVSLFLAMLVTFFTGLYIDRHKSRKPFFLSGGILSIVWLLRTQVVTVWGIVLSEVADRLSANAYKLFFDTAIIRRGKGSKAFAYFIYREVIVNSTAVLFWSLFCIFFLIDGGWTQLFIVASVGALLSMLVRDSRAELG